MAFTLPKAKQYQLPPEGTHRARCYRFIDLGTHKSQYGPSRQIRIDFELTDELMEDGRPFGVSRLYYDPNLGEKNRCRKDLDSWLGRGKVERSGFDMTSVVGKPALLTITHDDNGDSSFANIISISGLPKSMAKPEPINEPLIFELAAFNQVVFDKLPDRTKEKIRASAEWQQLQAVKEGEVKDQSASTSDGPDPDNDINF